MNFTNQMATHVVLLHQQEIVDLGSKVFLAWTYVQVRDRGEFLLLSFYPEDPSLLETSQ